MSSGRVDAWILPAPWKLRTPSARQGHGDRDVCPLADVGAEDVLGARFVGDVLDDSGGRSFEVVCRCRPNATVTQGTGVTLQASQPATPIAAASAAAPPRRPRLGTVRSRGNRATSAAAAASPISARSAPAVPMPGTSSRLKTRAPAIAPNVLAA